MTKWTAAGVAAVTALALAAGTFGTTYAAGDDGEAAGAANAQTQSDAAQTGQAAEAAPVAANCDAVTDWATLRDCVERGSSVKLADMITADGDDDTAGQTIIVKEKSSVSIGVADGKKSEEVGITGTKNADGTAARLRTASVFTVPANATLTFQGGTYKDLSADKKADGKNAVDGVLAYVNGDGTLAITGGAFTGNSTGSGSGGVFRADAGSVVTFGTEGKTEGPEFASNTAVNGGVMYSRGAVTVYGGSFHDNEAKGAGGSSQGGGVFHIKNNGVLTVRGGTFRSNLMSGGGNSNGGGAIYALGAKTYLYGGTFEGNGQDPAPGEQCGDSNSGKCWQSKTGGGAVFSDKGSLVVQGAVTFKGNYAKARNFNSGGGAIWAQDKLWIRNSAIGAGNPTFEGNWAAIKQPTAPATDTDVPTMLTGPATEITAGGAGGAVFLNNESEAYITGGTYLNNASGYLGGGIYTEEGTTTYVGKAVSFENKAGHFGGGLWFCPSGNSSASKGGNIALFANSVDNTLDANSGNDSIDSKSTMAGDDLAIMSPWYKSIYKIRNNTFQLMDTWFTNRANAAVDWYWDGTPAKEASGYQDKYLGGDATHAVSTHDGDTTYKQRYQNSTVSADNKVDINATSHAVTLCLSYTSGRNAEGKDWTNVNTTAYCEQYAPYNYADQGVAFKSVVKDQSAVEAAKQAAQITISGNGARLSGGGFGSNGRVIFDSPYTMEWQKADADTQQLVTSASEWTLSTSNSKLADRTDGEAKSPYMAMDLRPSECISAQQNAAKEEIPANCWRSSGTGEDTTWTVDIRDNDEDRDNDIPLDDKGNKVFGSISIDNLAPGTYTLKEKVAPTGYELNATEYTFTITGVDASGNPPQMPTLSPGTDLIGSDGRTIGDKPLQGTLAWSKTGVGGAAIAGSEWELSLNGTTSFDPIKVKDYCTSEAACAVAKDTADTNEAPGQFALDIKNKTKFPDGTYTLKETKAPDGYWLPSGGKSYTVTIDTDSSNSRTVTWGGGVDNLVVANAPSEVSWTKVDAGDANVKPEGAEWTLTKVKDANNQDIEKPQQVSWTVKDCGAKNVTDGCNATVTDATTPANNRWKDSDEQAGRFTLQLLLPGTYELKETKAPDGYVKTDTVYEFVIETTAIGDNEHVVLCPGEGHATGSTKCEQVGAVAAIPNVKPVSVLPFTGGTGLGRLLMGGGFAAAAALAAAVTYEWRRRRALDM